MSTLEVICSRCDKRFRVRAEFAGKTTRCPGCSAPITIGGSKPAHESREERAERPRPRSRPRDDDDDGPRRPAGNWKPVDTALGREQVAVVFILVTILSSFLVLCLGRMGGGPVGEDGIVIAVMLLLLVGPSLVAGIFGLTARVSALGAPAESLVKGSAVASLLCAIAGLACLVILGIASLARIDQHGPSSALPQVFAMVGLVLATLGAIGTFGGFVVQVGIARRSAEVSRAVGRTSVAASVCLLSVMAIGLLILLANELTTPNYPGYGPGGGYQGRPYRNDDEIELAIFGILLPLALGVFLIMYHRVLAAARRALQSDAGGFE